MPPPRPGLRSAGPLPSAYLARFLLSLCQPQGPGSRLCCHTSLQPSPHFTFRHPRQPPVNSTAPDLSVPKSGSDAPLPFLLPVLSLRPSQPVLPVPSTWDLLNASMPGSYFKPPASETLTMRPRHQHFKSQVQLGLRTLVYSEQTCLLSTANSITSLIYSTNVT